MSSRALRTHRTRDRRYLAGGMLALVLAAVAGYVSYTANAGLPWNPSYTVRVEVPDANRLIATSEVRVGGLRVGQVQRVDAVAGARPHARLTLSLVPSLEPLPVDARVTVRAASALGSTYVDLEPGTAAERLGDGDTLPLRRAAPAVDVTDLLDVFERRTARHVRTTLAGAGDGLAGRGRAVNVTLGAMRRLVGALEPVSRRLASTPAHSGTPVPAADRPASSPARPDAREPTAGPAPPPARLRRFLTAFRAAATAFADVAPQLAGVAAGGARTFGALAAERDALAAAIEAAPGAEQATTAAFTAARPGLDGLARLSRALLPAADRIPSGLRALDATLAAGVRPLTGVPAFAPRLADALDALGTLAADPATAGSLRKLRDMTGALGETLDVLLPAQLHCNVIGLWGQSFAGAFSALGTGHGPSVPSLIVTTQGANGEMFQNAQPSPDVGINPIPNEDASECESGNEPWTGAQLLNNPPGLQSTTTRPSVPPPGVRAWAQQAGLLGAPGGNR